MRSCNQSVHPSIHLRFIHQTFERGLHRSQVIVRTIDTGGAGPVTALLEARRMVQCEGACLASQNTFLNRNFLHITFLRSGLEAGGRLAASLRACGQKTVADIFPGDVFAFFVRYTPRRSAYMPAVKTCA